MATKQEFSSFQDLISDSEKMILVDFFATWCGPCQLMAGFLEQANPQLKDHIKTVKVNVDAYPNIAGQYDIHALPTLVLFKQGQPVHRIEGVIRPEQLVQQMRQFF
jgi:thioredoxin